MKLRKRRVQTNMFINPWKEKELNLSQIRPVHLDQIKKRDFLKHSVFELEFQLISLCLNSEPNIHRLNLEIQSLFDSIN